MIVVCSEFVEQYPHTFSNEFEHCLLYKTNCKMLQNTVYHDKFSHFPVTKPKTLHRLVKAKYLLPSSLICSFASTKIITVVFY